jgi:hypothetical protein
MSGSAPKIELTEQERTQLENIPRKPSTTQGLAMRANIIGHGESRRDLRQDIGERNWSAGGCADGDDVDSLRRRKKRGGGRGRPLRGLRREGRSGLPPRDYGIVKDQHANFRWVKPNDRSGTPE